MTPKPTSKTTPATPTAPENLLKKHSIDAREIITYCVPFDTVLTLLAEIFKDPSYRQLGIRFSGRDQDDKLLCHIQAEFSLKYRNSH
jgi:hypothetical protein